MNNSLECTKNLIFSTNLHVSFQVCFHTDGLKCNCVPILLLIPINSDSYNVTKEGKYNIC